ncbi:MAG TPA: hypothetical protein VK766_07145 [Cytophagaceae bacterium]|jgi:outer membrane protein assembly factor BamB|nr:hypothetical protein [Cytophagaceae bacterium]
MKRILFALILILLFGCKKKIKPIASMEVENVREFITTDKYLILVGGSFGKYQINIYDRNNRKLAKYDIKQAGSISTVINGDTIYVSGSESLIAYLIPNNLPILDVDKRNYSLSISNGRVQYLFFTKHRVDIMNFNNKIHSILIPIADSNTIEPYRSFFDGNNLFFKSYEHVDTREKEKSFVTFLNCYDTIGKQVWKRPAEELIDDLYNGKKGLFRSNFNETTNKSMLFYLDKKSGNTIWETELSTKILDGYICWIESINTNFLVKTCDNFYFLDSKGIILWSKKQKTTTIDVYYKMPHTSGDTLFYDNKDNESITLININTGQDIKTIYYEIPEEDKIADKLFENIGFDKNYFYVPTKEKVFKFSY